MNKEKRMADLSKNFSEQAEDIAAENNQASQGIKNKIFTGLDIISFLSLSFVVFGILTLGFLVAPVVFKDINPRVLASDIMSDIFSRYYPLAFYSILISLGAELLKLLLQSGKLLRAKLWVFNFLLILSITFLTGYTNFVLLPQINEMRASQKSPTLWTDNNFIKAHKQSESFAKIVFMLGLIPLCLMVSGKRRIN